MSTTTSTNTVRDALPEIFSGETEDANRWVNAMEVYFRVNPSTFTMLREGNYGSSRISEGGTHEEMLRSQDQKVL